jgi:hypothetical protein
MYYLYINIKKEIIMCKKLIKFIGCFCFVLSLNLSVLANPHEALYFTININHYEIEPVDHHQTESINIRLIVPKEPILVIHDRPSNKISKVTIHDFLAYLSQPDNQTLILTLMIINPQNQNLQPLDFRVTKVDYCSFTHLLRFVAEAQNPEKLKDMWPATGGNKILSGTDTVLFLDG